MWQQSTPKFSDALKGQMLTSSSHTPRVLLMFLTEKLCQLCAVPLVQLQIHFY